MFDLIKIYIFMENNEQEYLECPLLVSEATNRRMNYEYNPLSRN